MAGGERATGLLAMATVNWQWERLAPFADGHARPARRTPRLGPPQTEAADGPGLSLVPVRCSPGAVPVPSRCLPRRHRRPPACHARCHLPSPDAIRIVHALVIWITCITKHTLGFDLICLLPYNLLLLNAGVCCHECPLPLRPPSSDTSPLALDSVSPTWPFNNSSKFSTFVPRTLETGHQNTIASSLLEP